MIHPDSPLQAQPVVLVADDDDKSLRQVSSILSTQGYVVRIASSSQAVLESAYNTPPDLILIDSQLPNLGGYTICELLKHDQRTHDVPIIFLAPRQLVDDIPRIFAAGASDYLGKPLVPDELLARVRVHLSVQKLERHQQQQAEQLQHEIGGRRLAEEALRGREAEFRLVFEQSPIGIAMGAPDYRYSYVNDAFCAITGYTRDELLELGFPAITHPGDRDRDIVLASKLVSGELEQYAIEKRYLHKDGRIVWANLTARLVRSLQGEPLYYLGLIEDISARKEVEAALRASEEHYHRLFEASIDAIVIVDDDGVFVDANAAAAGLFGTPRDELIGTSVGQLRTVDGPDATELFRRYVVQGLDRGEFSLAWPDGTFRVLQYAASRIGPHKHQAILRNITERKAVEAELKRARNAAEEATRAKSEFVAQMSHEIRTPLNTVIGLTTLLLTSPLTPAQRDDVETIRRSGDALLTLIDDILDFSKIEAGKLALEYQAFGLQACVEEALDLVAPLADAKQLALCYRPDQALPDMFIGDPARLRQVLVNLLSNAVRFTERGTVTVAVTGSRQAGEATTAGSWELAISVCDTGSGIAPEQLERIFQPFVQASTPTGQRYGGTGLGLTISRRLAALMGGQIHALSELGIGSTFTVNLVLEASADERMSYPPVVQPVLLGKQALLVVEEAALGKMLAQQLSFWGMLPTVHTTFEALAFLTAKHPVDVVLLADEQPIVPDLALIDVLRNTAKRPNLPVVLWTAVSQRGAALARIDPSCTGLLPLPIRPGALHDALARLLTNTAPEVVALDPLLDATLGVRHPLRILLAEDNPTNQQVAQRLLAKLGYRVDLAANGLEVLDALRRQHYDLILMDVQMPVMNGTEATNYIRGYWPVAHQPRIAAMTAYASEENRAWLLGAGMDDYIRKPVRLPELVRVLQAASEAQRSDYRHISLAADNTQQALDHDQLAEFLSTVATGDPAADDSFLAIYVADMDAQVQLLHKEQIQGKDATIAQVAHTLKGLCLQIGAYELATLCSRLEAAGLAGAEDPANVLSEIDAVYPAVRRTLLESRAHGIAAEPEPGAIE